MSVSILPLAETPKSPIIKLLRLIGSPLMAGYEMPAEGDFESGELYQHAVKNKMPLLYLEALKRKGGLRQLVAEYEREHSRHLNMLGAILGVSQVLNAAAIEHVIVKTVNRFPVASNDVDVLIMGGDEMYRQAIEVMCSVGYYPGLPGSRDSGKAIVSPTGVKLLDAMHNISVDLQKEMAVSYITYLHKEKLKGHVMETELSGQRGIRVLTASQDLATVIMHSLMEQTYLLWEYYAFLHRLSEMSEKEIGEFLVIVKEHHMTVAARSHITITAMLHKAAFGTMPQKLESVLNRIGVETSEAKNLAKNKFRVPHKYAIATIARLLLEKTGESKFRKGLGLQIVKMLNPRLAWSVAKDLIEMRTRETYVSEV